MENTDLITFDNKKSRGEATIHIGNCIDYLRNQVELGVQYDAVVTDPPYEIGLHGKDWDSTGIAFSTEFWSLIHSVLKPGGYLLSFTASRLYHRVACAIEDSDFKIYPMLTWEFTNGLPKPVNVSELFDRDNIKDRKPIGFRKGSGFTKANAEHGAQQRLTKDFPIYERGVSEEAKRWLGHYYGYNAFKPSGEPIVMAQKAQSETRMIDNIRLHGVGAMNLGKLKDTRGEWPTTVFRHSKAKKADHQSNHPSVKPVPLMRELCQLVVPAGGHVLDPFGGTGTTAEAAIMDGFNCTIIEQNPEMEAVIRARLSK